MVDALTPRPDVVRTISRPDGGEFFARNGILFETIDEVRRDTAELIKAEPFLGTLAADPTLRGVLGAHFAVDRRGAPEKNDARRSEASGHRYRGRPGPPRRRKAPRLLLAKADQRPSAGAVGVSSVREHPAGPQFRRSPARRRRDEGHPGGDRKVGLTPDRGVTVRLTGSVALSDEEFATIADGAALNGVVTMLVVLLVLWLALKQARIILAVLINLAVGLTFTAAIGPVDGRSVEPHFGRLRRAVRGTWRRFRHPVQRSLSRRTVRGPRSPRGSPSDGAPAWRGPLLLAAASIAAAFYSFLPTAYVGLSELGLIAGTGMIIAFATTITLLPALLACAQTGRRDRLRSVGLRSRLSIVFLTGGAIGSSARP